MTKPARRPGSRTGAPAAALLKSSAAPRPQPVPAPVAVPAPTMADAPDGPAPDPVTGVTLPPLPSEPPPLPEGVTEGFAPPPENATTAAELEATESELLEGVGEEVPVDPVTGEAAVIPETHRGGYSEELARELEEAQERARAGAGQGQANLTHPEEHRQTQAKYRQVAADIRARGDVATVEEAQALQAAAQTVPVETMAERAARLAAEAKAEYERRVAEMPDDEPRYVVGPRPPRPKVAGHTLNIGDVVPGAFAFPRLETWVSSGVLRKVSG